MKVLEFLELARQIKHANKNDLISDKKFKKICSDYEKEISKSSKN